MQLTLGKVPYCILLTLFSSSDSEGEEQEVNKAVPTEQKKKKNKGAKNKDVFEVDMRTKGELGFEVGTWLF